MTERNVMDRIRWESRSDGTLHTSYGEVYDCTIEPTGEGWSWTVEGTWDTEATGHDEAEEGARRAAETELRALVEPLRRLIGRRVLSIWVSPNQHFLRVETDQGPLGFYAHGDCCSESWFADLTGVDALRGRVVSSVEALDMPDDHQERSRQSDDKVYGYCITTDRGHATLAFRNSSNGYYGGSLSLDASAMTKATVEIVDDWSA